MQKFLNLFVLILIHLMIVQYSYAAPAYGTRMPQQGKIFGGLQTYQILDHDLEDNNGGLESQQYFALLSYGVFDWLSIDLKGGLGDTDQQNEGFNEIHYPTFLAGGYGFRVRLYESEDSKVKAVFGFQHISVHPYSIDLSSDVRGERFKVVIDDWQFSLLGSYQFCKMFTLYGGGRWDRMDSINWINGERNRVKPDDVWGAIAGFDLGLTERTWINVEGNFIDAEAVAASLNFAF